MTELRKTITVKKVIDRILVRMEVRETARNLKLNLQEQARISMAAYNVVSSMDMGISCEGVVLFIQVTDGKREGLQVVCSSNKINNNRITSNLFDDTSWLVDEMNVENITPDGARVSVTIWAS